jgi:hypothetical protein
MSCAGYVSRIERDEIAYKTVLGNPVGMRPGERYGVQMGIIRVIKPISGF